MYIFLKYIITLFCKKLRIKIVVCLLRESGPWTLASVKNCCAFTFTPWCLFFFSNFLLKIRLTRLSEIFRILWGYLTFSTFIKYILYWESLVGVTKKNVYLLNINSTRHGVTNFEFDNYRAYKRLWT